MRSLPTWRPVAGVYYHIIMSSIIDPLRFLQEAPVKPPVQHDLFDAGATPPVQATGLFADIVFDRPLDHAYTYHVPAGLASAIAVGKRVLAPFGKGDRRTVGYCVRLSETGPEHGMKELANVID